MRRRSFWTDGPGSFVIAIGLALIIRWAFLEAYVIPSPSMIPTLLINDHIFVSKIAFGLRVPFSEKWLLKWGKPERGDVVVFLYPGDKDKFYVKRVVGIPGDKILIENGNLYLNNTLIERTIPDSLQDDWQWITDSDFPGDKDVGGKNLYVHWQESLDENAYSVTLRKDGANRTTFGPIVVPEGHYFVLGDNRDNSEDSRAWPADTRVATGSVTFWRDQVGPDIVLNKDLKISSSNGDVQFVTTQEVTLSGLSAEVSVQAVEAGAIGNQAPGQLTKLENAELAKLVNVNNSKSTHGGVDKRFVPRESIMGRASFVLLSCDQTLPVVSFLCNPLTIRWARFFHQVH